MMRRRLFVGLIATFGLWACDETNPAQPDTEPQMAVVPVSVAAAPAISTLTITVSASDIASDLVFNVTMTNGEATDTITIPAGSDRTITVRGYDASNIETHRGTKTVNLTEGVNPQLTVVLEGLTGDQPLVVALGETTVAVSPETATVSVGGTTQLAAVVTDEAGDTLAVSVRWASSHPAVATVDETGMVSGVSLGSASLIATYGGVGASAAVTVSDAVFPTEGLVAWYPFSGDANDATTNPLSSNRVQVTGVGEVRDVLVSAGVQTDIGVAALSTSLTLVEAPDTVEAFSSARIVWDVDDPTGVLRESFGKGVSFGTTPWGQDASSPDRRGASSQEVISPSVVRYESLLPGQPSAGTLYWQLYLDRYISGAWGDNRLILTKPTIAKGESLNTIAVVNP